MTFQQKFYALAAALVLYSIGTLGLTIYLSQHSYQPAGVALLHGKTPLPNLKAISDIPQRKQTFVALLEPLIAEKNQALLGLRREVLALHKKLNEGSALTRVEQERLERLARRYNIRVEGLTPLETSSLLLKRVDIIPPSMVVAQAAKESGWGTSRFAREGNNLFGQWCYTKGCGIVPGRRSAGARHEVQKFPGIEDAINAYYHNINTHKTYRELRNIRARARQSHSQLSGLNLIQGLNGYSSRGEVYVQELAELIRYNQFAKLDISTAELTDS
ncbi:glucosaminidase domain-containing protein [Gilvimarinus sp. DA14]|uniref:glucosaminidase domain-containing protein n=1 Tax=Gilvimarinus sp. DA14 TaxID=2956798 RepID=UPI0020B894F6|nr:glucosaminidase domain-containing protein [Gilvimarinus sp. DA14]UTF61640.1 glucosaminidase domain-containing protein [Gilvimarinus sp. DA14]